jgi:transcriptional regulator with GAF, ATPase, and Fis domain
MKGQTMLSPARQPVNDDSADLPAWGAVPELAQPALQRDDTGSLVHPLDASAAAGQSGVRLRLGDLAARCATVESHAIDDTLVDGLRQMAEAMSVDRAILWRKAADDALPVASHWWTRDPESSPSELLELAATSLVSSKLQTGEAACLTGIDELTDPVDRDAFLRSGVRSIAVVPVAVVDSASRVQAVLAFTSPSPKPYWAPAILDDMRLVSGVVSLALARQANHHALQRATDELRQLRAGSHKEETEQNRPITKVLRSSRWIVSESAVVRRALGQVEQVAPTPSTVLLLGETGAGKEVFAQAIHELSARRQRQMIRVSCAAIPSALIESELFGRERGAYTGALSRQIGRFEAAHQSTLFLDEIGELSPEVQVKLLRVLQDRVLERLGSTQPIRVDVRIIAATNRNLAKAVEDKVFREDLYYRLNVFPIVVPPLRERVEDIPGLVWEFVNEFSKSLGKPIDSISKESMRQLQLYSWPGNVRELRNVIERAVIISDGPRLTVPIPQPALSRQPQGSTTLRNLEIDHIRATLEATNWRIRGHLGAAERLGLKPTTLETRMAKLGLVRPKV